MDKPELFVDGKRVDGRALDELRPVKVDAGVLSNADGSAYVEWGKNKVIAAVYGPREHIPRHGQNPYKANVRVKYNMTPFCSIDGHGRSGPNRRSTEISKVLEEVYENVVLTDHFPKTAIDVFIEVLQADGGTRIAALTAGAVALANAGIPMKDVVAGAASGKAGGKMILDLGKLEDNYGESDIPIGISPRTKEILLMQMDGLLTKQEIAEAIDLSFKGAEKVSELQKKALKDCYDKKMSEAGQGAQQ